MYTTERKRDTGLRIKQAREYAGFTQAQLAQKLGIKFSSTISIWEKGTSMPQNGSALNQIAQYCGVSYKWLATGVGTMTGESSIETGVKLSDTNAEDFARQLDKKRSDFKATYKDNKFKFFTPREVLPSVFSDGGKIYAIGRLDEPDSCLAIALSDLSVKELQQIMNNPDVYIFYKLRENA